MNSSHSSPERPLESTLAADCDSAPQENSSEFEISNSSDKSEGLSYQCKILNSERKHEAFTKECAIVESIPLLSKYNKNALDETEHISCKYMALETENNEPNNIKDFTISSPEINEMSNSENEILTLQNDGKIFTSDTVYLYEENKTALDALLKQSSNNESNSFAPIGQVLPLNQILLGNEVNELISDDKKLVLKQTGGGQENSIEKNTLKGELCFGDTVCFQDELGGQNLTDLTNLNTRNDSCSNFFKIQNSYSKEFGDMTSNECTITENLAVNITFDNENRIRSKELMNGTFINNSQVKEEVSKENSETSVIESCIVSDDKEFANKNIKGSDTVITESIISPIKIFDMNQVLETRSKQLKEQENMTISSVSSLELDNCTYATSLAEVYEIDTCLVQTPILTQTSMEIETAGERAYNLPEKCADENQNVSLSQKNSEMKGESHSEVLLIQNSLYKDATSNGLSLCQTSNKKNKFSEDEFKPLEMKLNYHKIEYDLPSTTSTMNFESFDNLIFPLFATQIYEQNRLKMITETPALSQILKSNEANQGIHCELSKRYFNMEDSLILEPFTVKKNLEDAEIGECSELCSVKNCKNLMEIGNTTEKTSVPCNHNTTFEHNLKSKTNDKVVANLNYALSSYDAETSNLDSVENVSSLSTSIPQFDKGIEKNIFDMPILARVSDENNKLSGPCFKLNLNVKESIQVCDPPILHENVEIAEKFDKLPICVSLCKSDYEHVSEQSKNGKKEVEEDAGCENLPSETMTLDNFELGVAICTEDTLMHIDETDVCEELNNAVSLKQISKTINSDATTVLSNNLISNANKDELFSLSNEHIEESPTAEMCELKAVLKGSCKDEIENKPPTPLSISERIVEGKSEETSDMEVIASVDDKTANNLENEFIAGNNLRKNLNEMHESAVKLQAEVSVTTEIVSERKNSEKDFSGEENRVNGSINQENAVKQIIEMPDIKFLRKIPKCTDIKLQQLDAKKEVVINECNNIHSEMSLAKETVLKSKHENSSIVFKENLVLKDNVSEKQFSNGEVTKDAELGKVSGDKMSEIKLRNIDGKRSKSDRNESFTHCTLRKQYETSGSLYKHIAKNKPNTDEKSKGLSDKNVSSKEEKIVDECNKMEDSNKMQKRAKKYPEIELYKPGMGLKKRTIKDQIASSISNDRKLNHANKNDNKDSKRTLLPNELSKQSEENFKSTTPVDQARNKISNKGISDTRKEKARSIISNIHSQVNCDAYSDIKSKHHSKLTSQEGSRIITNTEKDTNDDIDEHTIKPISQKYLVKGRARTYFNSNQSHSLHHSGHQDTTPSESPLNMKNGALEVDRNDLQNDIQTNKKLNKDYRISPSDNEDRVKSKYIYSSKYKTQHIKKYHESDRKDWHTSTSCEQSSEIDEWDDDVVVSGSTSNILNKKQTHAISDDPVHQQNNTIVSSFALNINANKTNKTIENSFSSENLSKSETETEDEIFEKSLKFENKSHAYSHSRSSDYANIQSLKRNKPFKDNVLSPAKTSRVKIKNAINEQKSREEKECISEKGEKRKERGEKEYISEKGEKRKEREEKVSVSEKGEKKKDSLEKEEILQFLLKKDINSDKVDFQQKTNERHSKGGGIIRLPTESTHETCPFAPITSKSHTERAAIQDEPTLIQKQLFDPNNPDKPLVITVPCSYVSYSGPPSPANAFSSSASEICTVNTSFILPGQSWQHNYYQYPTDYTGDVSADLLLRQEGQKRIKPIIEKNLREIAILERELQSYIAQGFEIGDSAPLGQCWQKLQLYFENIILANPRYCAENNIEQLLWKTVFYQVIEALRRKAEIPYKQEIMNETIINIVDKGTIYFENLLMKQQEIFGFNLENFLDPEVVWPKDIPDAVRMTLISVQKILIYLGDLARYREQATKTTNYGKARSWYLKAQQIAPKNGRPYNQLAIVAIHTKRKLDAVYYYMRSLAASNPFLSARESLLSLFEEIRKKYEVIEKCHAEETALNAASVWRKSDVLEEEEKYEIWIHPDGSSSKRSSKLDNEQKYQLDDLSNVDLNKKFLLSFLHVHGKLFTKIGMETFTNTVNKMLEEFSCLLKRSPLPLGALRLVQLMAINIFAVANTTLKGVDQEMNPFCRSLLQEQALQVTFAMVTLIIERTIILLQEHRSSEDYPSELVSEDIAQILPSIKIWIDWMSCHLQLWIPPPATGDFKICYRYNIWTLYADLLTTLQDFEINHVEFVKNKDEGYETVVLPEDNTLAGFIPLIGAVQNSMHVKTPFDKEQARNSLRLTRIHFFGDYLCGMQDPYLKFDVENKQYVSLVITSESAENIEATQDTKWESSEDDIDSQEDESLEKNSDTSQSQEEKEIQRLWSRKEALRKAKEEQDHHRAQIQAVLQETRHKRPTVLEVRPCYLVPDTNCFIDHLPRMKSLLTCGLFRIVVPLVVINELDGLARGCLEDNTIPIDTHTRRVGQLAKDAVLFLEERFASRESRLRAITSKGSILDTISFRSEDVSDSKGTNDDLILSCCLHYCKDRPEQFMPRDPDTPIRLIREAALLTEDRNLRVKALAQNVPAKDLPSFLRWAKIR